MLISHKHKFLTIDIQKTATRSLRQTLFMQHPIPVDFVGKPTCDMGLSQHGTIENAQNGFREMGWNIDEYFKFTVVRNPWARWYSLLNWMKSQAELAHHPNFNDFELPKQQHVTIMKNFFNSFTSDIEAFKSIINTNLAQHEYYTIDDKIAVDHIALFENLEAEFKLLCDKTNIKYTPLKWKNKTTCATSMYDFYTEECVEMVREKEAYTIALRGYEF